MKPAPRQGMLRVYGADPEQWARRYRVEPFEHPCRECGRVFVVNVPFVMGRLKGLTAEVCECGNEDTPYCFPFDQLPGPR